MLTIEYSKDGECCSDFEVKEKVQKIIEDYMNDLIGSSYFHTSSGALINQFLISVLDGSIDSENTQFKSGINCYGVTDDGYFVGGFGTVNQDQVMEIFSLRMLQFEGKVYYEKV